MQRVDPTTLRSLIAVRDLLADTASEQRKLTELGRIASYSPFHFHRLFSSTFGSSPLEFQRHVRFERARDLLISTNHDLLEICIRVGYASPATFARQFKHRTGLTPMQYRHQARRCFHVGRWKSSSFIPLCMTQQWLNP